jgi:hypothetical protein
MSSRPRSLCASASLREIPDIECHRNAARFSQNEPLFCRSQDSFRTRICAGQRDAAEQNDWVLLGKTGTPMDPQLATHDCLTTCDRSAKNRVYKTYKTSSANACCHAVRPAKPRAGVPAPIASSVQISRPQIAGFLLFSIAAIYEHRYSTHAYTNWLLGRLASAGPTADVSREQSLLVLGTILVDKGSFHGHRHCQQPSRYRHSHPKLPRCEPYGQV